MFLLPKILSLNDKINIQGQTFYERSRLTISLVTGFNLPDYSNVACQLDISFNESDKIAIQIIENGTTQLVNDQNIASDFFADPKSFDVAFSVRSEGMLGIIVGESYLETITLRHDVNNIRFLTVHGDIDKITRLDFNFG